MDGCVQVVELKVGMHCDRCIKSIKKAIKTIDGTKASDPLDKNSLTFHTCSI